MHTDRVTRPNASFQQWQALLTNRRKRSQTGTFLVHGVRPIDAALANGVGIDAVLCRSGALSPWALEIVETVRAERVVELSPELMGELDEKNDAAAELLLVAKLPDSRLGQIPRGGGFIVVLDRPQNPGNIGTVVRSADALGAAMVIITGHAADAYDPKAVRASRGSLFAVPVASAASASEVLEWSGAAFQVLGLSEDGDSPLWECDLLAPTLAIVGNETVGVSRQWRDACTEIATIPMTGTASSLNAASSASITLYEYARQKVAMTTVALSEENATSRDLINCRRFT